MSTNQGVTACTAPVTGRHKAAATKAKCPACSPLAATPKGMSAMPRVDEARIARGKDTPPDVLAQMARSGSDDVRLSVAENLNTPQEAIDYIALEDPNKYNREAAAEHPSLSADAVASLFTDEFYGVRMSAALRKDATTEQLRNLAYNEDHAMVLAAIVTNPRAPMTTVRDLLRRDDCEINESILDQDDIPESVIEALLWSGDDDIRSAAIYHPCTSHEKRVRFAQSDNESDRKAAAEGFLWDGKPTLGIHPRNASARRYLLDNSDWWTLTAEDDAVALALATHRNP